MAAQTQEVSFSKPLQERKLLKTYFKRGLAWALQESSFLEFRIWQAAAKLLKDESLASIYLMIFKHRQLGSLKIFLREGKAFWKHGFWFLYLQLVGTEKKLRKRKRQFHLTSLPFRGQAASTHRAACSGWQLLLFRVHRVHLGCEGKGRRPGFQPAGGYSVCPGRSAPLLDAGSLSPPALPGLC